jgi:hypothetical protein
VPRLAVVRARHSGDALHVGRDEDLHRRSSDMC